jgi:hypothetical protein
MASSPDYFARYSTVPLQEQIREAARLSTHLLMLYGNVTGATTRMSATSAKLPVLSLTAEGTLAIEQVALPAGAMVATLGTGAGAVYVLSEARKAPGESGLKPFTADNFRENLSRLTGQLPEGAHAHHVFPQALAARFKVARIDVNDPRFGSWWERSTHLKNSVRYNARWMKFLENNPTREQILQFGRDLGGEFGFQVHF